MKIIITILVRLSILIQFVANKDQNYFPNLPMGEYKVFCKAILQCEPKVTNGIQINWYLSKTSANTTEVKGNITLNVPFDNSYDFTANFAVRDLIGGWKDNAHIGKLPNACQSMRFFLGTSWIPFLKKYGLKNYDCPIPPGQYVLTSGIDTSIFTSPGSNWPKIFFYGSYKAKFTVTKKKKDIACIIFVLDIKRSWEAE